MKLASKRNIRATLATLLIVVSLLVPLSPLQAAELGSRRLQLGSAEPNVATSYTFSFNVISTTNIGSIEFEFCENDPFVGTACTAPSGFDASGATLSAQSGETGFLIDPISNTNRIVLSRSPTAATPGQLGYSFDSVINPSGASNSFYARLATYSSVDATGSPIDSGGLAASTTTSINVQAFVPPYLTFCVGIVIFDNDCATAAGVQVQLGSLSESTTATGFSKMLAATNAPDGYVISMLGRTMTSGNNQINPIQSPSNSQTGVAQFGLNLRTNSNPAVGLEPAGPGTAQPASDYATPNQFKFENGDTLVTTNVPNDLVTFTKSYIVNIPEDQKKGIYTTTLTYICTATF